MNTKPQAAFTQGILKLFQLNGSESRVVPVSEPTQNFALTTKVRQWSFETFDWPFSNAMDANGDA